MCLLSVTHIGRLLRACTRRRRPIAWALRYFVRLLMSRPVFPGGAVRLCVLLGFWSYCLVIPYHHHAGPARASTASKNVRWKEGIHLLRYSCAFPPRVLLSPCAPPAYTFKWGVINIVRWIPQLIWLLFKVFFHAAFTQSLCFNIVAWNHVCL